MIRSAATRGAAFVHRDRAQHPGLRPAAYPGLPNHAPPVARVEAKPKPGAHHGRNPGRIVAKTRGAAFVHGNHQNLAPSRAPYPAYNRHAESAGQSRRA